MYSLRNSAGPRKQLFRLVAGFALLSASVLAAAQDKSGGKGSLRAEYQYIRTGDFFDDSLVFGSSGGDIGTTDTHALLLSGNYSISDHWTIFASLPYVQKRHRGTNPHNFLEFANFDPPDRRLVDDGNYHGGFQDLAFGVRYLALVGPVRISPYVSYGVPVDNYPIYGKAAIGANLWSIPVGVQFDYLPYFSDWKFGGNVAYVMRERPLGVNVDYWLIYASAGYYFAPRIFGSVFIVAKDTPHGVRLPDDFTDDPTYQDLADFDSELWWQHDRVLGHSFTNVGLGIDYVLSKRYQVSGQTWTTVKARQVNEIDYAVGLALTMFFGAD